MLMAMHARAAGRTPRRFCASITRAEAAINTERRHSGETKAEVVGCGWLAMFEISVTQTRSSFCVGTATMASRYRVAAPTKNGKVIAMADFDDTNPDAQIVSYSELDTFRQRSVPS